MIKQISGKEALERLKDKRHMGGDLFYFCYFSGRPTPPPHPIPLGGPDVVFHREKNCSARKHTHRASAKNIGDGDGDGTASVARL